MSEPRWKTVWITGASTGIGREAARQLASAGCRVAVSARSAEKLQGLEAESERIVAFPVDVTDEQAAAEVVERIESQLGPIDLAILGAGMYQPVELDALDPAPFALTIHVNYLGVINCLAALLPRMRKRRGGHLSWIASVAGYRGLPKAAAYGPSKAALINLAESLKPALARENIHVSVVNPGFVETPMTAVNDFKMPFVMPPDEAARRMIKGLQTGRFEVAFPSRFVIILKALRILPYRVYFWLIGRFVLRS